MLKKYFATGVVILLPVALTIAIVIFIFNLLTEPFAGIAKAVMNYYHIFQNGFLFFTSDQIQQAMGQFIILIFLFFLTVALGALTRWFFIHYLIRYSESIVNRIPFINTVYKTCNDVIKTLFASKTNSFKQVVLVPYPNAQTYCIGFVTREDLPNFKDFQNNDTIAVFVPTTPNPTSGFLMMFRKSDVIFLTMKVDEAFKFIVSCGIMYPEFVSIDGNRPNVENQ